MKCINCDKKINSNICPSCGKDNTRINNLINLSNHYYNLGLDLANDGKITKAIVELKKATDIYKNNITAVNLLGLCLYRVGRYTEALNEWIYSANVEELDNPASMYLDILDKDEEFIKIVNQCIDNYNKCIDLVESNNIKVAILQLQKLSDKMPEMIEPQLLLAMLRIKENDYINATRTLRKVLTIDVDNEDALRYLSEIEKVKDRFTVQKIEKIREEANNNTKDKNSLLREYSVGRTAIDLLVGILVGVGVMLFLVMPAIKDKQGANNKNVVLDQNQQITDLKKQLETVNNQNKNLDEENKNIQKENEAKKEDNKTLAEALYQAGASGFEGKNFSKADEFLQMSLKYDDTNPEVYILYLRTKLILGEMAEGEKITEEIGKKFPNSKEATRAKDILEATKRQINGE